MDFSNHHTLAAFKATMDKDVRQKQHWRAGPIINGQPKFDKQAETRYSPNNLSEVIGNASKASAEDVEEAISIATAATRTWRETSAEERATILERAADAFQAAMPELISILNREAGKSIPDSMSEVREDRKSTRLNSSH